MSPTLAIAGLRAPIGRARRRAPRERMLDPAERRLGEPVLPDLGRAERWGPWRARRLRPACAPHVKSARAARPPAVDECRIFARRRVTEVAEHVHRFVIAEHDDDPAAGLGASAWSCWRLRMILSESAPRSVMSPSWTRTVLPPAQWFAASTSPAARAMSIQARNRRGGRLRRRFVAAPARWPQHWLAAWQEPRRQEIPSPSHPEPPHHGASSGLAPRSTNEQCAVPDFA